MSRSFATLCAAASILACSSSGAPPTVTRVDISSTAGSMGATELHNDPGSATHSLPAPPDSVWQALPRVYETLGIPDAGMVPNQRVYGARNVRVRRIEEKRLSTYIDCGMGITATPKADEYDVTMSLVSTLTAANDGSSIVETVLEATARPRATTGQRVSCQSNGTLEKRVGELLLWMLVSGR